MHRFFSTQNLCTHDTHFRKIKAMIYKEVQYSNVKSHTGLYYFLNTIFYEKVKKTQPAAV